MSTFARQDERQEAGSDCKCVAHASARMSRPAKTPFIWFVSPTAAFLRRCPIICLRSEPLVPFCNKPCWTLFLSILCYFSGHSHLTACFLHFLQRWTETVTVPFLNFFCNSSYKPGWSWMHYLHLLALLRFWTSFIIDFFFFPVLINSKARLPFITDAEICTCKRFM